MASSVAPQCSSVSLLDVCRPALLTGVSQRGCCSHHPLPHLLAPQETGHFLADWLEDSDLYRVVLDFASRLIG